ncbi:hypothetical protein ABZ917_07690 [Nonomuraea wenchangensis]
MHGERGTLPVSAVEGESKHASIRRLLIRALRKSGFRKLCKGEESDFSVGGTLISVHLLFAVAVGLSIFMLNTFELNLITGGLIVFGVILAGVIGNMIFGLPLIVPYLALLVSWVGVGLLELWSGGLGVFWPTHVLPFAITVGTQLAVRAVRLSAHVPLFVPLTLIIVLLPLLTEDPWRLASSSGVRLIWLALIALVPLGALFAIRLARLSVRDILADAAARSSHMMDPEKEVFRALKSIHNDRDGLLDRDAVDRYLKPVYANAWTELELIQTVEAVERAFRWRALRRFGALAIGIIIAIWGLIYSLAWAVVPTSLAQDWSAQEIKSVSLNFADLHLMLPVGPYVAVATLFAIVACVGFLGFALTEDQYSEALWNAVVKRPADLCLLLALPYLRLADRADPAEQKASRRSKRRDAIDS